MRNMFEQVVTACEQALKDGNKFKALALCKQAVTVTNDPVYLSRVNGFIAALLENVTIKGGKA